MFISPLFRNERGEEGGGITKTKKLGKKRVGGGTGETITLPLLPLNPVLAVSQL